MEQQRRFINFFHSSLLQNKNPRKVDGVEYDLHKSLCCLCFILLVCLHLPERESRKQNKMKQDHYDVDDDTTVDEV